LESKKKQELKNRRNKDKQEPTFILLLLLLPLIKEKREREWHFYGRNEGRLYLAANGFTVGSAVDGVSCGSPNV